MALKPSSTHSRNMVVVFDPVEQEKAEQAPERFRRKRVAAYARVSTEQDAQQNSYEAQIDFYSGYIRSKTEWQFVKVYADEGITGTSYKNRDGFNEMVADAKAGKIDLILTKSISRFARNTVDSLTITRELKKHGVEVYFEKENISSMDPQAELIFTIMSSVAQEESRSISENVRWGRERSHEAGKVSLPWSRFLGYEKGPDGLPKIVEEEAIIVRNIYQWFLDGLSFKQIADKLTSLGVKTPAGKNVWSMGTVRSILSNEKYKGDARLQKTYTVDFLSKEVRVNHGERKQWYIHDSHDAIIKPETFELVQKEIARRTCRRGRYTVSPFANKLICGHCGAFYGHKTWHSDRPSKKHLWLCGKKYEGEDICQTPKLEDYQIIEAYLVALNRMIRSLGQYTAEYKERFLWQIGNNNSLTATRDSLKAEIEDLIAQAKQLVLENAKKAQDQDAYEKEYNALCEQIETKRSELAKVNEEITANLTRREEVKLFLDSIKDSSAEIKEFNIEQWHHIVEDVLVMPNKTLVFRFRNGQKETVDLSLIPIKQNDGSQSLVL